MSITSIPNLFRALLPLDCQNGWLAMLRAYFDDSGTHDPSDIVLLAGIFGTEWQLSTLDRLWKEHLERPLSGRKPPLKRFHMYDCQNSLGEFVGWSRTETDYYCHQLRTAIIDSHVSGYGTACARKDWDDLVTGDIRANVGDSEGFCVRNCFIKSIAWAQHNTFDPEMTFVFDNRPHRQRENKVIFDAFQRVIGLPSLVGIAFLTSHKVRPLQAADMIAWELYQHAGDILIEGMPVPRRLELQHLGRNMNFEGRRDQITNVVEIWKKTPPELLKQMADHFTNFDPDSVLATRSF